MKVFHQNCDNCGKRISLPLPKASVRRLCPYCDAHIRLEVFPALLKESASGKVGEALIIADDSSCFYHPSKKAEIPCDGCGRFLCSTCDIEFNDQHLCSNCIEKGVVKGAEKEQLEHLQKGITQYDKIALYIAVFSMFIFYVSIFTAPVVLYISIRYWKRPLSVLPRNRWRYVLASSLALIQFFGWLGMFGFMTSII